MLQFLQLITVAVAFRAKGPEETSLNLDDFAPLCDEEIVRDTCRLLNEGEKHDQVEKYTTWQEISEHLSSEGGALDDQMGTLGYKADDGKVWLECMSLCQSIVHFVTDAGVCPPKSDISCYTLMDETFCDVDVRPSVLKTLGPKSDEDLPDFGDNDFLKMRGRQMEGPVENAVMPGTEMDSDVPLAEGIHYGVWEAIERLANLFRIYPSPRAHTSESSAAEEATPAEESDAAPPPSLLQRGAASRRLGGMTPEEARLNLQKEELAKAYMALVTRAFSARETEAHMTRWFGRDAFYQPMARKEVLRVLNSVSHMISNVYYVYPGPMCKPNTYAYVYPKGGLCRKSEMDEYACRMHRDTKQFVFYLCPLYFQRPQEMVETLVHEGSHHATAYTDDVEFKNGKAYGRRTCKQLAKEEPLQALKNADNFCYYIQDAAMEVSDHPADQARSNCPGFSETFRPDNDGDCKCPEGLGCHFGGRLGCPFSGTARRQVYSSNYFNLGCNGCSCEVQTTTSLDLFSWEGDRFGWNSNDKSEELAGSCPEHSALPEADSHGDCYCEGGRHCYQNGQKGCPFSGTDTHERRSPLYFSSSCSDCQCELI